MRGREPQSSKSNSNALTAESFRWERERGGTRTTDGIGKRARRPVLGWRMFLFVHRCRAGPSVPRVVDARGVGATYKVHRYHPRYVLGARPVTGPIFLGKLNYSLRALLYLEQAMPQKPPTEVYGGHIFPYQHTNWSAFSRAAYIHRTTKTCESRCARQGHTRNSVKRRAQYGKVFGVRLSHAHTLTRSTTPSGSDMGKVSPTLLMSPPTTCQALDI